MRLENGVNITFKIQLPNTGNIIEESVMKLTEAHARRQARPSICPEARSRYRQWHRIAGTAFAGLRPVRAWCVLFHFATVFLQSMRCIY